MQQQSPRAKENLEYDLENLKEAGKKVNAFGHSLTVFEQLFTIYSACLKLDTYDVEANFNMASLYYQNRDELKALKHYKKCVKKDETPDGQYMEIKSLFAQ